MLENRFKSLKMWPDFQVLNILQLLAISALLRMRPFLWGLNVDFWMPNFGHLFLKILAYICGENHEKIPVKLSLCRCTYIYACACVSSWHHKQVLIASSLWPHWMLVQRTLRAPFFLQRSQQLWFWSTFVLLVLNGCDTNACCTHLVSVPKWWEN